MITNKLNAVSDGYITVGGGIHSGISPILLQQDQCAYAKNITFRGSYPTTRPGFLAATLTGKDANFDSGYIQGIGFYRPALGIPVIMAVIGGRIYRLQLSNPNSRTFSITPLTQDGTPSIDRRLWDLNPSKMQAFFQQVGNELVIQNDHDSPRIYDNWQITVPGDDGIPTGGPMAFGQGRLYVAKNNQIYAGDIDGGPTSPLSFTETQYFSGGGYFKVPTDANGEGVRGMRFVSVGDTGTGQGELVVATYTTAHTLNVSAPRSTWQDIDIQKTLLLNSGSVSHKGMTSVNEDIWMRAKDGERSLRMAASEQKVWSRTPSSSEMKRILERDDPNWVRYTASTLFDNRLIWTVGHRGTKEGTGFAVLDFDPISALGQQVRPVYDGFWEASGVEPVDILTADFGSGERCFFIGKDSSGDTGLWEISRDATSDGGTDIEASLETRIFVFSDPFSHKKLDRADVFISEMRNDSSFSIDLRPDCETQWHLWGDKTRTHDNDVGDDEVAAAATVPPQMPDSGCSRLTFGTPTVAPVVNFSYPTTGVKDRGALFQLRLRWSGHLKMTRLWLHATGIVEQPTADVD